MKLKLSIVILVGALVLSGCQSEADKDMALIAVATNFRTTFEKLETVFERETDFEITQVSGATGSLYTQIVNGAPYHAFLSADQARPTALEKAGHASERFVYARGALALWSKSEDILSLPLADIVEDSAFKPLAIANPALAPYGKAAQDVFTAFGGDTKDRLVMGENVGQAFALVQSGNARAGFVALADAQRAQNGFYVTVPSELYTPIRQDAVVLARGQNHGAAMAFLDFLKSQKAQSLIAADGYTLETASP